MRLTFSRPAARLILLILTFTLMAALARVAGAAPVRTELPNGLTVIIDENHSSPVVAVQMWVRVGGADESDTEAGISHVFEHMLFKGTEKRAVGELARLVESVGGNINAYTSFDNTVYHLTVPSRHFSTGLDVISDAIQNSAFDPDELAKELEVVLEELRMNEDSPGRSMYKSILATAYSTHPYGRPVIGYKEVVSGLTRDEILKFFKKWYRPNNMTLVIAGDVDAGAALAEATESFKGFKKGWPRWRKRPAEPPQGEIRTEILTKNIMDTYMALAFHIPEIRSEDTYALDMLEGVLGSGATSRLYKALKIDANLVHGYSAYGMSLKDPGVFLITGTLEAEKTGPAITEILYQIKRLAEHGPTAEEMERVRLNIESSFVYSKQTMEGIASKLGYYESVAGDIAFDEEYLRGIRSTTPGDVMRVAEKYLDPERMSVSVQLPEAEKDAVTERLILMAVKAAEEKAASLGKEEDIRRPVASRVKLDSGITLVVKEMHENPTVAMYAALPGGLRFETPEKNGVGSFTAAMLNRGTTTRTMEAISKDEASIAGQVGGFSGWNTTGASAGFLSRYFDRGAELFADVLLNPSFPQEEIERLRPDVIAGIKRQEDNLPSYTFKLMLGAMYERHPYGLQTSGTVESVQGLTRDDLVEHYKRFFVPERMVITVVGDVETEHVVARMNELFKGAATEPPALPVPPVEEPQTAIRATGDVKDKAQTNIAIGFPGTTIGHPDSYPLRVLSEVLSGQGGRLFLELRDRLSLAYSVSSFLKVGADPGIFGLYIASAPEKKDAAIAGLLSEIERISKEPVTPEELERAKNSIIGGYEIGLQTPGSQAADMTNFELFGMGYDFQPKYVELIEAVTAGDVLEAAKKYLDLNAYTISVVGPNGEEPGEAPEEEAAQ